MGRSFHIIKFIMSDRPIELVGVVLGEREEKAEEQFPKTGKF
jgi:hypothetical protein